MYRSVRIRRFRCFRDLSVESLAPVNLIAGRNNVGKTSLLEALFLHAGGTNPQLALLLAGLRGLEVRYSVPPTGPAPWDSIFHNLDRTQPVEISGIDLDGKVRRTKLTSLNGGPLNGSGTETESDETSRSYIDTARPRGWILKLEYDDGSTRSEYKVRLGREGPEVDEHPAPPFPTVFVSSRGRGGGHDDVERYSRLSIGRRAQPVLETMRIVEPRLQSLSINVHLGLPVVCADIGLPELLPVQVLGDGVSRVLALVTSIADCQGGMVLIDEIDGGLHHSMFRPIWRAVIDLAWRLNVQLFATTHSHECLIAARSAASELAAPVFRLHRLDQVGDDIRAVTYDDEALDGAIAADIEVR